MSDATIKIGAFDATAAAFASAKARLTALGQAGSVLNEKFVAIGAVIGGAFAAAGIKQLIGGVAEGLDKLNDLSDATGSSVEKLSALEDTAARTGTSLETVGSALIKLNKTIADAKPGTDAENALKAIGLSAQQLKDLDPADALLRVSQGLARFNDDGNKARLTQELFGKSLREVAPLLKDLAEKGQLNTTVTKEQADAAEKFRQNSDALQKNLLDLARTISGPLIGAMNEFAERKKKVGFLAALFGETDTQKQIAEANSLADSVKKVGDAFARATANANNAELPGGARAKWAEDAAKLRVQLDDLLRRAAAATDKLKGTTGQQSARDVLRGLEAASAERPSAPDAGNAAEAAEIEKRFEAQLARIHDAIRATAQLTEVEKLEIAVAEKSAELRGFNARKLETLIGLTRTMEEVTGKAAEARLRRDRQNQQGGPTDESGNIIANVDALAKQSKAAQIEQLALQIGSVRDQMSGASGASLERFRRALGVLDEQMKALQDNTKGVSEKLNQFNEDVKEAAGGIQEAFGASLAAVMEGNARKIDRIWGSLIKQMVLKAQTAQLMQVLFGKNFVSGGELGGFFGGLFSGGSSVSGGGEVNGVGDVVKNVLVGSSKAGGVTINYNGGQSFGAGVSPSGVMAAMEATRAQTKADIANAQKRGRSIG